MKYVIAIIICSCSIWACKKTAVSSASDTIYKGVVLQNICCLDVIQAIGTDLPGQDNWVDSNTPPPYATYHHVFKVANPCQFGSHAAGDTIRFKVIDQQPQNCACCMLFAYTPATSLPVQVIN